MRKLVIFLLVLTANVAFAQRTVSGLITDKNSQPIEGVAVKDKNTNVKSVTDTAGKYSIKVPDGSKSLEFSKADFKVEDAEIIGNVLNITMTALRDVDLFELSLEELMNLEVVSASKKAVKITEAPAIISVITAQQINDAGYQSVAEALQTIPGIDLLYDGLHSNFGVRGINGGLNAWSRILKVMIDNQPVSFRASSENWLDKELIPISAVQRIEVVRGPSSALYGAHAFLGVVNIITRNSEESGGAVSPSVGLINNNLTYGGEAVFWKKIKQFDFLFSASKFSENRSGLGLKNIPMKTVYDESIVSSNDMSQPMSILAKASYTSSLLGNFGVDFNYQYVDTYGEFQEWGVLTHKNRINQNNYYLRASYNKSFSQKDFQYISLTYTHGQALQNEHLMVNQIGLADWLSRIVGYSGLNLNYEFRYSVGKQSTITAGVEYNRDNQQLQTYFYNFNNNTSQPTDRLLGDTIFSNYGVYLQSIIYPFELFQKDVPLGFTFGIRYDGNSIYGNEINYRLAGVYQLSENLSTKLLYGTSYKAPAASQLYSTIMVPNGVKGNPELKPENANTMEIELGGKITNNLLFSITGFYNNVTDKVEFVKDPGLTSNVIPMNVDKIKSFGSEVSLSYYKKYFNCYANLSYQNSSFERKNRNGITSTYEAKLFPSFMLKSGGTWRLPKLHLCLHAEMRYTSQRLSSEQNTYLFDPVDKKPYKLDPYSVYDVTLSSLNIIFFENLETIFKLKVNNVLNTKYYYPGFKNFDIQGGGRTLHFTLTQLF